MAGGRGEQGSWDVGEGLLRSGLSKGSGKLTGLCDEGTSGMGPGWGGGGHRTGGGGAVGRGLGPGAEVPWVGLLLKQPQYFTHHTPFIFI